MLSVSEAEERAAALVEAAVKAGADAADALYVGDASTEVQVRLGALEDVDPLRRRGDRPALLRRPALGERLLVRSVRRRARRAGRARGGDGARGARGPLCRASRPTTGCCAAARPDLEADDGADPSPVALKAARAGDGGGGARGRRGHQQRRRRASSAGRTVIALATSHGFVRGYTTSGYSGSASVIAGERRRRCSATMPATASAIMPISTRPRRSAGSPASARSSGSIPASSPSGTMPVLFDPRVGGSLIGHLLGAMSGPGDRPQDQLPARPRGRARSSPTASRSSTIRTGRAACARKPFDGEGVATAAAPAGRRRAADRLAAQQRLGAAARAGDRPAMPRAASAAPPGVGATNVHLEPGALDARRR